MPSAGDRSQHFPAIERKHGRPVSHFLDQLRGLDVSKYEDQMAYLQENHGFSRTHANALVMYHRGSTTSRRHEGPEAWFAALEPDRRRTARSIFDALTARFPDLDLVVAWNQPMLRTGSDYVFGLSVSKNHFTMNPMSRTPLAETGLDLSGYRVNKFTVVVPIDWHVDVALLHQIVEFRLAEIAAN